MAALVEKGTISVIARQVARELASTRVRAPGSSSGGFSAVLGPNNEGTGRTYIRRGTQEILQMYSESPWLRALAKKTAFAVASTQWYLYKETDAPSSQSEAESARWRSPVQRTLSSRRFQSMSRSEQSRYLQHLVKEGTIELVPQHPFYELMERPNPIQSGQWLREVQTLHYDLVGDAFTVIEQDIRTGYPVALWVIPPQWVKRVPKREDGVFEIQPTGQGRPIEYPRNVMLWMSDPDPLMPYGRGAGFGMVLGDELSTDEHAAKHIRHVLINQAISPLVVTVEGAPDDELRSFAERWRETLQGYWNAGKTRFLNRKAEVTKIDTTPKDLELNSLRQFERDIAMQTWGMPPEILGILESSNRATIESADYLMGKHVTQPRLEVQRLTIQNQLMPWYDEPGLVAMYESPIEEDKEFKLRVFVAAPWSQRVNEWRTLAGSEELEGDEGELYPLPAGIAGTAEILGGDSAADLLGPDDEEDPPEDDETPPEDDDDAPDDEDDTTEPLVDDEEEEALPSVVNKATFTTSQLERILRVLQVDDIRGELQPSIRDAVEHFGSQMVDRLGLGVDFNSENHSVVDFIKAKSLDRAKRINATTKSQIRNILVQGEVQGWQLGEIESKIAEFFDFSETARARSIASTEMGRASNYGALEGMKQGGVEGKEWLSSRDDLVRESHAELDGEKVGLNEEFISSVTGAGAQFPGEFGVAGEDINCRCTILAVIDEDKSFAETERRRTTFWKRYDETRRRFERQTSRAMRRAFKAQRKKVLGALKEVV